MHFSVNAKIHISLIHVSIAARGLKWCTVVLGVVEIVQLQQRPASSWCGDLSSVAAAHSTRPSHMHYAFIIPHYTSQTALKVKPPFTLEAFDFVSVKRIASFLIQDWTDRSYLEKAAHKITRVLLIVIALGQHVKPSRRWRNFGNGGRGFIGICEERNQQHQTGAVDCRIRILCAAV